LDDGTQLILRDKNDLAYELRRNRLMLAGKVLSTSIGKSVFRVKKESLGEFLREMKYSGN